MAANRGAERARDEEEERKKGVYGSSYVFVLKSSFAKRQNINIISLLLLVLARDDFPAEERLTLIRGSPFLFWLRSQVSGEERKEKEKRSLSSHPPRFFHMFSQSVPSPSFSLSHSQTCLHSLESVMTLTVLPFLF